MTSSPASKAEHLLVVFLKEPIEGQVKRSLAKTLGNTEAAARYKALCAVLLQQLVGLQNTRIRFCVTPSDAVEAVQFWILPQLEGKIDKLQEDLFLFHPNKAAETLEIEFVAQQDSDKKEAVLTQQKKGLEQGYTTVSIMGTNCPDCGARWLQMAIMMCNRAEDIVLGHDEQSSIYLSTVRQPTYLHHTTDTPFLNLPQLPKIKTEQQWQQALESPIGGKIKKLYNKVNS